MPEPIRVLYMIDNLLFGGAQRDLGQMATAFAARGFEQEVICLNRADRELLAIFEAAKVPVHRYTPLQVATGVAVWKTRSLLRRGEFDILVTILPVSETVGKIAGRCAGVPVSISMILQHKERWQLLANRLVSAWVDVGVVNTERLRSFSIEHEGIPDNRLLTINNGVELPVEDPEETKRVRAELGIQADATIVGCTGRLSEEKGQNHLLAAFLEIADTEENVHLVLSGDGPLREELEQARTVSSCPERIHLLGNRNDVPRLLPAYDIYVQPSMHEGMPNALLEAMAAGLPCVVSRAGGMVDVVVENETGCFSEPGNVADLAKGIRVLLDDPQKGEAWGRQGRQRVEQHFSLQRMLEQYESLFRDQMSRVMNARSQTHATAS